ncbi:hypothetical protein [Chryseobacterium aquaticum]|uniref:hypothetical protein n=1 Tax=Chryseobacterium aquaticum TaxID=452084 RepID=UPI003F713791
MKKDQKIRKLEKLESFKLKNEKLDTILGGTDFLASAFAFVATGTPTGGGELSFPEESGCYCYSYTSDIDFGNGGIGYNGSQRIDKPC